ncbi:MAG: GGDEF domain-containing protein [Myxococcota bacterium]
MGHLDARNTGRSVPLWGTALGLVLLAVAGGAFTAASLTLIAGGRAYVHGEGRWSKAQQEAVFYLDRFAEKGRPRDLAQARRALRVPLGDMEARAAMEAPELDRERARGGLLQGQNDPRDIPKMIWMYRYFANAPYVRDAVAVWAESDDHIMALAALANRLEEEWRSPAPEAATIVDIRQDLGRLDHTLRRLETRFSHHLSEGMRHLEALVALLSAAVLLALATAALGLFRWATRRVRASERKFWASFEHAPLGMVLLADEGTLQEVNDTFCSIVGRPRSELLGMRIANLLHPDDVEGEHASLPVPPGGRDDTTVVEARLVRPDGTTLWGRLSASEFPDDGRGTRSIAVLEDVSEARALAEELSYQATHDPLTGLLNRRTFERELDEALLEVREKGTEHTLAFVDLDRFKRVNDTCGHAAGDAALRKIAGLIGENLRTSDVLARLGGDEFGIILRRCPVDRGKKVLAGVREALARNTFTWDGHTFSVGSSVGVVNVHGGTPDAASVMRAADLACYQAKGQGGGCVEGRATG